MITLLSPNFFQQSSQLQTNITFTGSFDNNRGAAATSMSGIYRPWAGRSTTYAYIQAGHHTALKLGSDPTSCPAPFGLVTAGALNVHRLTRVILLIALHAKATYAGNKAYDGSVADLFAVQAVRTIPTAGLQAGPNTSRVQVKAAFKVWLENRTVTGISGSLRFRLEGGSALQYNSIRLAAHFSDYGRPTSIKLPSKCTRT